MRFGAGWLSAGVAALLLTAGCKEGKPVGEKTPGAQSAEQAQKQSEKAFDQARKAQEKATQTEQQAQQPVAQAPGASTAVQGEQVIVGEVLTVNDREVLVSSRGEPQVRLQVQPGTQILVDGRQARATDIQEGSQVRASFRTDQGEPTATRIEVTTTQRNTAPATPESGESSPGDQERPFQPDQQ